MLTRWGERTCRRRVAGIVCAGSVLLAVSCASAAPEPPGSSTPAVTSEDSGAALVDVTDAAQVAAWTTVNDPVMGGASTSQVTYGDGGLVFSGDVSLQNNGGFASARSPEDPEIGGRAAGATSLRVRAVGDGKIYLLKVGIAVQPWSYIQRFPTEAGVEQIHDLPVAGFEPVGMRLDPAPEAPTTLNPAEIDQVAVYILDKQQGPFMITINDIGAIR